MRTDGDQHTTKAEKMQLIHVLSDDAILRGAAYFVDWRKTRNALFLFDALRMLNAAEQAWDQARRQLPMRREWQVLRRCVMRGLESLGTKLIDARTPAQTELAIYPGAKRATLARADQLSEPSRRPSWVRRSIRLPGSWRDGASRGRGNI